MISHPHNWVFVTGAKLGIYLCPFSHKNWSVGGGLRRDTERKRKRRYSSWMQISFSLRAFLIITHLHDYIFATGAKLGLHVCMYILKHCCDQAEKIGYYSRFIYLSPFLSPHPPLFNFPRWTPNDFTPVQLIFCKLGKTFGFISVFQSIKLSCVHIWRPY